MVLRSAYLICATPRTGSFLLCEALNNVGLAGRPREFLRRCVVPGWSDAQYHRYFDGIFRRGTTENGVFGLKVMWMHFEDLLSELQRRSGEEMQHSLDRFLPRLRYIKITRNDKVLQAISLYRALQDQRWDRIDNSVGAQPLHFDYAAVERLRQEIALEEQHWQRYFALRQIQPLTVVYEQFIVAYEQTARQILDYLQIPTPAHLTFSERHLRRQADATTAEWYALYHQARQPHSG